MRLEASLWDFGGTIWVLIVIYSILRMLVAIYMYKEKTTSASYPQLKVHWRLVPYINWETNSI